MNDMLNDPRVRRILSELRAISDDAMLETCNSLDSLALASRTSAYGASLAKLDLIVCLAMDISGQPTSVISGTMESLLGRMLLTVAHARIVFTTRREAAHQCAGALDDLDKVRSIATRLLLQLRRELVETFPEETSDAAPEPAPAVS